MDLYNFHPELRVLKKLKKLNFILLKNNKHFMQYSDGIIDIFLVKHYYTKYLFYVYDSRYQKLLFKLSPYDYHEFELYRKFYKNLRLQKKKNETNF